MSQKRGRSEYTSSKYTWEERTLIAKLGVAWRASGKSIANFGEFLDSAKCHVPLSTLRDWVNKMDADGRVYLPEKKSGNSKKMSGEQEKLTVGMVLWRILNNQRVMPMDVVGWIDQEFQLKVSVTLVRRMMNSHDIVIRKAQTKAAGYQVDLQPLVQMYYDFVRPLRGKVFRRYDSSCIASIDFTYVSHRNRTSYGYGLRGR